MFLCHFGLVYKLAKRTIKSNKNQYRLDDIISLIMFNSSSSRKKSLTPLPPPDPTTQKFPLPQRGGWGGWLVWIENSGGSSSLKSQNLLNPIFFLELHLNNNYYLQIIIHVLRTVPSTHWL